MKQTLTLFCCIYFSMSVAAQAGQNTTFLTLKSLSGIRAISGSLAKPLGHAITASDVSDSLMYSRFIEFKLTQGKPEIILSAKLQKYKIGEVNITFDTDFDKEYTDEKTIHIVDASKTVLIDCEQGVSIQLKYPDSISKQTINNLKWLPFTCIRLIINDEDSVYKKYAGAVYGEELLYGTSPLIDDSLCVVIQNKLFDVVYAYWSAPQLAIVPKRYFDHASKPSVKYYKVGDTLLINPSFLASSQYDGHKQTILLEKLSSNAPIGTEVGFYVDTSKQYQNISERVNSLIDTNKKLTLLEFWGTWCGPCIQLYPALDSMLTAFVRQIHYQGVAFDKQKDLVKKYVKAKPQIRNQIFVDMNQQDSNAKNLVDIFKVSNFPTFMLIDQSGKILLRETGIDGFQNLKQYLLNQKR